MTTVDDFRGSVSGTGPDPAFGPALQALWLARKGDWDRAHERVQDHEGDPDCDLVHAHLHRQEGDPENARHWYRAAGLQLPAGTLDEEWDALVMRLLARTADRPAPRAR